MNAIYYIGLDIHKKTIAYCIKRIDHAVELKVAHAAMLKAITAAKKKNDRADAEKIADLFEG